MIQMASNENPLGPSPKAIAVFRDAASGLNRYPLYHDERLPEAIAEAHGSGLTGEHVVTGASGSEILEIIARAYLKPGAEVIISTPAFPVYMSTAEQQGATVIDVPLDPDTFEVRVEAMLDAVTSRTRVVYLTNPGNPTGVMTTADQIGTLIDGLPEGVLLVADEVYHHYVDHADYPDTVGYAVAGREIAAIHTFSKVYGLAGLRFGYGYASLPVAAKMRAIRRVYHMSSFAAEMGMAALSDTDHINKTVTLALEQRAVLEKGLTELGVEFFPTQANFVLLRMAPGTAAGITEALGEKGVAVRCTAGNQFADGIRVTLGLPEENAAFLKALGEVLGSSRGDRGLAL